MNKSLGFLVALVAIIGVAGGIYYYKKSATPEPAPVVQATPSPSESPEARYPVPSDASLKLNQPLPKLNESDATLEETLINLFGKELFESLFNPKDIIRRFVVTVENAREPQMPVDFLPFNAIETPFRVTKKNGKLFIDSKNDERYLPYVKLAEAADAKKIAAVYFHFYPLIQKAYHEITKGYFNDRLIQVIDKVLSTPTPDAPIELMSLNTSYRYADPKLENLPAIQKAILRMGNDNAKVVKEKLKQLRNSLILGV